MRAGTGHLEQIGRGWFLRYRERATDAAGRTRAVQRRVRLGDASQFRSRASARAAADVWLRSRSAQSLQPGPTVLAGEYFEHFVATHVPLMRRTSQRRYRSAVYRHLEPRFGASALDKIDGPAIQRWISDIAPTLARESIRGLRAILLQMLRQAAADGFSCHRIEARSVRLPKETRAGRERREINDADLVKLLAVTESPWWLLWGLMGYAGLRVGEALGLEWRHIDLDAEIIQVRQAAVLRRIQPTKTEASKRDLPILPELKLLLERRLLELPQAPGPTDLLFATRRGTPRSADHVRERILRPALAAAGVRACGLHAFRHGLPGRLLRLGASPDVVQRMMRHVSLKQTETYLHSGNLDLRAALDMARNRTAASAAA